MRGRRSEGLDVREARKDKKTTNFRTKGNQTRRKIRRKKNN